ncbi:MAG: hypothetical protein K2R98_29230 [Gemmataceae bacterium]|nr:hypothetical protein [Gemmataceae bacterium]
MFLRTFCAGLLLIASILMTGCCHKRHCCRPCACPCSCGYSPAEEPLPTTAPIAPATVQPASLGTPVPY